LKKLTWDVPHQVRPRRNLEDKGCFTIPVTLGNLSINHALLDLGTSCNLMPHSFLENIGHLNLKLANMTLQFADGSENKALWKSVRMTIKENHITFITNFFVMDIEENYQIPIILGRSFIRTTHATINVRK